MIKKLVPPPLVRPFQKFFELEAASGIVLLFCTMVALGIANSSLHAPYKSFLDLTVLFLPVHLWINDGLMAVFFFVVGMEIKRELARGELSTPKQAALPLIAAFGGMVVPAVIYFMFNPVPPDSKGWGVPMATDIAFAVGVLSLFGKRVPFSLKVFLLALAIVDDLGAVLVIAFFYTANISGAALGASILLLVSILLLQQAGIRSKIYYVILGALAWVAMLKSGVHATIAGVLIGFLTPHQALEGDSESPLDQLVRWLHPWVAFFIMPVFALTNAGVAFIDMNFREVISTGVFKGVFFGLLVGKVLGIFGASWLSVQLKLAKLPEGVNWAKIFAVSILGGIGFTMSLFIAGLALDPEHLEWAKAGVLLGSLFSGLVGLCFMANTLKSIKISQLPGAQ